MNKSKLKEMVNVAIELRDKDIMVRLFRDNNFIMSEDSYISLSEYNDDLTHKNIKDFDIMKVYTINTSTIATLSDLLYSNFSEYDGDLIWERKDD